MTTQPAPSEEEPRVLPNPTIDEQEMDFEAAQQMLAHAENIRQPGERKQVTLPQAAIDELWRYTQSYDYIDADWLSRYCGVTYGEACAVIEEFQSQGRISKQYDFSKGSYLVLKNDATIQRDFESRKIPASEQANNERGKRFLGKLGVGPAKSETHRLTEERRKAIAKEDEEWENKRKWQIHIGPRPLSPYHKAKQQALAQSRDEASSPEEPAAKPKMPLTEEGARRQYSQYFTNEYLSSLGERARRASAQAVRDYKHKSGLEKDDTLSTETLQEIRRHVKAEVIKQHIGNDASPELIQALSEAIFA
jgi:hypothetical protein